MMKTVLAWLKAHARQLATLAAWAFVMYISRRWPAHLADVELVASTLALMVGIQLPPFKFSAETIAKIVTSAFVLVFVFVPLAIFAACSPRLTAKTLYDVQKHACLDSYSKRADQLACEKRVDDAWNEAGAPPAATDSLDAGKDAVSE